MKQLETNRLCLRKFAEDDFSAVHDYASVLENTVFMPWGPSAEPETRTFISMAIAKAEESPCTDYQYAIVLKETGRLIGGCGLTVSGDKAELGWILHRDFWKRGLATEMGNALLALGFDGLKLHRILAYCDAENIASYRVMEKIGMRMEGLFIEGRPPHKLSDRDYSDGLSYAITRGEWDTYKEIAHYTALPCVFDGFIDMPSLSDGVVHLVCTEKKEAIPEKNYVPAYVFAICVGSEKVGQIDLRIGFRGGLHGSSLYYGGHIGYSIHEAHRGRGYAGRACRLLLPVAKAHHMDKLLITNAHTNGASRRVCEKLGARLLRVARLPKWHDLYAAGLRFVNVFEWSTNS